MKTNPIITLNNSGFKIANKVWSIPNTYSLTIQSNASGTASSDAMIGTQNYQTNLYATPIQGAVLSGWNVTGGIITNNIFTFSNTDAIIEPVFEEQTMTLWNGSFDDTSWQSTFTKIDSDGTVQIDTAEQFVNCCNGASVFYENNNLTSLNIVLRNDIWLNDVLNLNTATDVRNTLINLGSTRIANTNTNCFMDIAGGKTITINGNNHRIIGLYVYGSTNNNAGAFARVDNSTLKFENLTFDRCLFRSNAQASAAFIMNNANGFVQTKYLNFNKCAIASESTSNYQALMFGFLNTNANTKFEHIYTSFYKCGYIASRSWAEYSCGDGGISNWSSSPRFISIWTNCTNIESYKISGSGSIYVFYGNRANATLTNATYYGLNNIIEQGTSEESVSDAIDNFNTNAEVKLYIYNDNLYQMT